MGLLNRRLTMFVKSPFNAFPLEVVSGITSRAVLFQYQVF